MHTYTLCGVQGTICVWLNKEKKASTCKIKRIHAKTVIFGIIPREMKLNLSRRALHKNTICLIHYTFKMIKAIFQLSSLSPAPWCGGILLSFSLIIYVSIILLLAPLVLKAFVFCSFAKSPKGIYFSSWKMGSNSTCIIFLFCNPIYQLTRNILCDACNFWYYWFSTFH